LVDPGVDWRKILKCIFEKCNREALTGLIWLRIGIKALVNAVINYRVP
jgi:hypothetical protein